ncbi:heavy metal translocating P-type ATPase [Desulfohalovibrio reitneri]|uniref:heavy metal translocating P-type ATPase n=1 Tax=Desulfohalovibrio reitneri TaxID=1307759 RepID=UPI0004A6D0B1|nr:heavy metal translocating P-type ATPase [Desulfohalovibrio reitneri]
MSIVRSIPGRIRFDVGSEEAFAKVRDQLLDDLGGELGELELRYNPRSGRGLALFSPDEGATSRALEILADILHTSLPMTLPPCRGADLGDERACAPPGLHPGGHAETPLEHPFVSVARKVFLFFLRRRFMPMRIRPYFVAFTVAPLILEGLRSLVRGRINVSVLDASAVGSAMLMRDFDTAGSIHLLLEVSEDLEDWTREKSRGDLASLYRGDGRPAWVQRGEGEVQISQDELRQGDLVVVRSGARIPVDGVVADGTAMVNQSSMTGEPLSVKRGPGKEVFAGTVVEEGKLIIYSESVGDETRFAKIAQVISDSESMKADVHSHAVQLADRIVPLSFVLFGVVFAFTRNWMKASSVLMADYSCAIKIATPLAVRSAMLESAHFGAVIKGGKYIEQLSKADAIVLDKTGTLTKASPEVVRVCPVNGYSRSYVLRNAACMEEHFPHPIADAIVRKADEEGLVHDERHAEVEYTLAHGVSTTLGDDRLVLGSRHFISDDEGIHIDDSQEAVAECTRQGLSTLYLGVGGELAGVIALEDPLRESAYRFVRRLENMGMRRIVMLTGDGEASAKAVAGEVEIKEYHSQVLPDDKTRIVDELREEGHIVAMVGDGINDSAALSRADVGISMKHGADIAQEACDVMLTVDRLDSLVDSITLSRLAMKRIRNNYGFIVASNTAFIGLGVSGLITPALLAFLHNSGTVLTCAWSMRPYLSRK